MTTPNVSAVARAHLEDLLNLSLSESSDTAASRAAIHSLLTGQEGPPVCLQWWRVAIEVLDFAVEHGRPPTLRTGEARLANWVKHQNRRQRRLHDDYQLALLDSIPGWDFDARAAQRRARLDELTLFVKERGRLPVRHKPDGEDNLAKWMYKAQRDVRTTQHLGIARHDLNRALSGEE